MAKRSKSDKGIEEQNTRGFTRREWKDVGYDPDQWATAAPVTEHQPASPAIETLIAQLRSDQGDELLARIKAHDLAPQVKGSQGGPTAHRLAHQLEYARESTWFAAAEAIAQEFSVSTATPAGANGDHPAHDERIPVAEAIAKVATQVNGDGSPSQAQLFDTSKPFNFKGAWMEIEAKQAEIDELARIYEDDARKARESKKQLDEAHTLLGRIVNTYRSRRLQKQKEAELRAERAASGDRCAFERDEKKPCPICHADSPALAIAALDENRTVFTDRWSEAHRRAAQDVELTDLEALMDFSSAELVQEALELGNYYPGFQRVDGWTLVERAEALAWVDRGAHDADRPAHVDLPHVAGEADPEGQSCCACGVRLHEFTGDAEEGLSYPAGALVGTSCPGATLNASERSA